MAPELYAYKLHSYISKLHIYVCRSNSEQSRLKKKKKVASVRARPNGWPRSVCE